MTMFFLISAYSLCMTMPRHLRTGRGKTSFYVHRLCRILPLFYVMLGISICFFMSRGVVFKSFQIFLNMTCLYNFVPGQQESIVMAGWTIGVEMLFYAVFPFIYQKFDTLLKVLLLFVGSLLASLIFEFICPWESYTHLSIVRHFPVFVWGMVLFLIGKKWQGLTHFRLALSIFLCLTAIITYANIDILPQWHGMNYYLQLIPFSCLFFGLLLYPLPVLVSKGTAFLGTISYSTYLLHPLILVNMQGVFSHLAAFDLGQPMNFLLYALTTLAVVLPVAYVFFLLVEKTGIRLGKWLMAPAAGAAPQDMALVLADTAVGNGEGDGASPGPALNPNE
uniref:Putative acyltransferase n=1 Tax=Desulfovibrio sp. U5L TaxID=596152 RepID=I2Q7R6_9BACT